MALDQILEERLKKLENIKNAGVDPYTASVNRQQTIKEARDMMGQKVAVAGRLRSLRTHGKISFADLEDESGKIQIFFQENDLGEEKYNFLKNLDIGDFIEVSGEVFTTQAGETTVKVFEYKLLTKSLYPLPSTYYGLDDVEERYRQRYVDLIMNPEVKEVFDTRHKVIRFIRHYMEDKGFIEVETPTMQPIYGGATAKPFVTHHNALDTDFYLRISDELYLKRLIVGGYEKIFEICKDFRNEGIDRQHNPEFTMMEFYWAYANYEDLMKLTEELVSKAVFEIHGKYTFEYEGQELDFTPPFERVTFADLVKTHSGVDLNEIKTEEALLEAVREKGIKLDLEGVVGYGPLCDELYKKVARPLIKNPTFVTDYPYAMKPLAKKVEGQPHLSASFQLLCVGYELVNAYNELNDPHEQRARWEEQMDLAKKGLEEHQIIDEDYIRALEYGMPPTAGWGMGIDRFVSLLTNQHSIKDVILFPTLKPEKKVNTSPVIVSASEKSQENISTDNGKSPTREEAYQLMTEMIKNKNLQKHGVAVEAIMRSLCKYLKEKHPDLSDTEFLEDEWAVVGLLHDADYELIEKDASRHTLVTEQMLRDRGFNNMRVINGIKSHHDGIKDSRDNLMEKSVYASDELSGLITATALVQPDKKLSSVTVESVMKKFKQPSFAAGANRNQILACEKELEIPLEEFVKIGLEAMQSIADDLGL